MQLCLLTPDLPDRHPRRDGEGQGEPRIPFNPNGRLAAILERRSELAADAYVFGSATGAFQVAVLITNDSDLAEPMRIVRQELNGDLRIPRPSGYDVLSRRGSPAPHALL
jgi:hypothetical protein